MAGNKTFQKQCEKISEDTGVSVTFYEDSPTDGPSTFEDDGSLHIRRRDGLRACFDVGDGQALPGWKQNARTRQVLGALGMKVPAWVLADETEETEEDEECCSECGRPY